MKSRAMSDAGPRAAEFWRPGPNGAVHCELCPQYCEIPPGSSGFCGARANNGGTLYAEGYGAVSAVALDPVEKKPLRMFGPGHGKYVLSVGGFGCNLRCPFCQNHGISAARPGFGRENAEYLTPGQVVKLALNSVGDGNIGVAYTYNEPLIGFEYMLDCAKLVRGAGLFNIAVTNGYINPGPLGALLPYTDAMNIDLKGFTEDFYRNLRGGLEPVKETITAAYKRCHIEVTTLVIPGENEDHIEELAVWLASVGSDIPLHLTRFFPRHQYVGRDPTPKETVYRLRDTAAKYLSHVFMGNM